MAVSEENVLVVRRSLFDGLGAFQGFSPEADRYLPALMKRENNFFARRASAETDPSLKQIIPYAIFRHGGRLLHYVRGGKSGEKRLVARGSVGIGGHINDWDEGLFSFDESAYRVAVEREIREELRIEGGFSDRVVGMINDDSTEVGSVHLGVVHLVTLDTDRVAAGEAAITRLEFLAVEELRRRREALEGWSQIVLDAWDEIKRGNGESRIAITNS
jgi:predicted NUDIX family phosphoesterase